MICPSIHSAIERVCASTACTSTCAHRVDVEAAGIELLVDVDIDPYWLPSFLLTLSCNEPKGQERRTRAMREQRVLYYRWEQFNSTIQLSFDNKRAWYYEFLTNRRLYILLYYGSLTLLKNSSLIFFCSLKKGFQCIIRVIGIYSALKWLILNLIVFVGCENLISGRGYNVRCCTYIELTVDWEDAVSSNLHV